MGYSPHRNIELQSCANKPKVQHISKMHKKIPRLSRLPRKYRKIRNSPTSHDIDVI